MKLDEEVKEVVKEREEVPEGRTARQETVLSPRDRTARPTMGTVLSPLARSARLGMVLPPPVRTTPQLRWKNEWQERFGAVDGIAPASSIFDFHCLLCRKDYHIGTMGLSSVTQHICQHNHQKKRVSACDRLKEKILLLLKESAEGLSKDDLIKLTAPSEELPLSDGMRSWALSTLTAEGEVIASQEGKVISRLEEVWYTGENFWLERAHQDATSEAPSSSGITIEQLRPAIVFLVKDKGMPYTEVAKLFDVKRHTVSNAVKRFEETGSFKNRAGQGRKLDSACVQEVRKHLLQNPRTTRKGRIVGNSVRKLGRKLRINREKVRRIYKNVLGLFPYKDVVRKKLTPLHRFQRVRLGKLLRTRFAGGRHRQILFSDESPFVIEQHHNAQNDRTYAEKGKPPPKEERTVERDMKPAGVMVWAAVGYNFKSKLYIMPKGLRIKTPDYLKVMKLFEAECKQKIGYTEEGWARTWTFQQDGARAHTSNESQRWLLDHFPDIIARHQWPALSPDINPIELIWGILKPRVNAEAHPDVKSLTRALNREWGLLSQEEINRAIDGWPGRLDAMIKTKGGRFE
jgi:transposase